MKYLVIVFFLTVSFVGCIQPLSLEQHEISDNIVIEPRLNFKTPLPSTLIFTNGDTLFTQLNHIKNGKKFSDLKLYELIIHNTSSNLNESEKYELKSKIMLNTISEIWIDSFQYKLFNYKDKRETNTVVHHHDVRKPKQQHYDIYVKLMYADSLAMYRTFKDERLYASAPLNSTTLFPVGTSKEAYYYLKIGNKYHNTGSNNQKAVQYLRYAFVKYPFFHEFVNRTTVKRGKMPAEKIFLNFIRQKADYEAKLRQQEN